MLVQKAGVPRQRTPIKFTTLDEYLDFIDRIGSWQKEGFEWYCSFSPALFYINDTPKELYIEGPHIIELCNELVEAKSDTGTKVRFRSSEADWKFYYSDKLNIEELKNKLLEWNKLIQAKIDSERLSEMVLTKEKKRSKKGVLEKLLEL